MSDMRENSLITEVLKVIKYIKLRQEGHPNSESEEILHDLHTHLCRLLSSMLGSPLTGRMFIPSTFAMIEPCERMHSLKSQLS